MNSKAILTSMPSQLRHSPRNRVRSLSAPPILNSLQATDLSAISDEKHDTPEPLEVKIQEADPTPKIQATIYHQQVMSILHKTLRWSDSIENKDAVSRVFDYRLRETAFHLSLIPQTGMTEATTVIYNKNESSSLLNFVYKKVCDDEAKYIPTKYATDNAVRLRSTTIPKKHACLNGGPQNTPLNLNNGTAIFPVYCGSENMLKSWEIREAINAFEEKAMRHYIIILCQHTDIKNTLIGSTTSSAELYQQWIEQNSDYIISDLTDNDISEADLARNAKITIITIDEWINLPELIKFSAYRHKFSTLPEWMLTPLYENAKKTVEDIVNSENLAQGYLLDLKDKTKIIKLPEPKQAIVFSDHLSTQPSLTFFNSNPPQLNGNLDFIVQSYLTPLIASAMPSLVNLYAHDPQGLGLYLAKAIKTFIDEVTPAAAATAQFKR